MSSKVRLEKNRLEELVKDFRKELHIHLKYRIEEPMYTVTKHVYQPVKDANRECELMKLSIIRHFNIIMPYDSPHPAT